MFGLYPVPGQQLVQSGGRIIGDTAQQIGKPRLRIDVVEFRRGDQGIHCSRSLTAAVGAGEERTSACVVERDESERIRPAPLKWSEIVAPRWETCDRTT
jgi:hypothetical protein